MGIEVVIDSGGGTDDNAIHDNVSSEISAITEKDPPIAGDFLIIEDSANSNVKKMVLVGNLPHTTSSDIERYPQRRLLPAGTSHSNDTTVGGDFRIPKAMTVTSVGAYFDTAGAGSVTTIDINESGTTILSTKLTVDAGSKTSVGAATPAVISDGAIAADAIITVDIDGAASGTAGKGLSVWLIGTITE